MKFLAIAQVFTAFAIAATSAAETNHLRKLTIDTSKGFLETKPAPEECESGERYCTCRDGSACTTSDECVERGNSGSCDVRQQNRNSGMSCRNGDECGNGNTSCSDGSKCKERGGGDDDYSYDEEEEEEYLEEN